jgi:hypothetical protein
MGFQGIRVVRERRRVDQSVSHWIGKWSRETGVGSSLYHPCYRNDLDAERG